MEINESKCDLNSCESDKEKDIIILDDDDFVQTTFNLFNPPIETNDHQENILIDLTSCDDFDLNDIFLMNSNSNMQFQQNQPAEPHDSHAQVPNIKNEFDFKVFNYNLTRENFGETIEEILIDDNDEILNADEENQNKNKDSEDPFGAYRTHDSSSETSSTNRSFKLKTSNEYKCDQCSKIFSKSYNYKRHIFLHQAKSQDTDDTDQSLTTNFSINECPKCNRRILDKSNYAKHLKICHLKSSKKNRHNQDSTQNPLFTNSHIPAKKQNTLFQCEICSKMFNKKFNYHRHIRVHFLNEIMNHQHDPLIGQSTSESLMNFNNIKAEIYECNKCQRKFASNKQLEIHQTKWHLTEYTCTYCEKNNLFLKFNEKFEYIKHLNLNHSIRFKFECNYCHKTFRYISQYYQHRQTHTHRANVYQESDENDKAHELSLHTCDLCGKSFSKVFNLNRHKSTQHFAQEGRDDASRKDFSRLKYNFNIRQKANYHRNKLNQQLNRINIS